MELTPYLFLNGRGSEAIEFYAAKLGAKAEFVQRFKDGPTGPDGKCMGPPEGIMHASLRVGGSTLMLSDGETDRKVPTGGFSISISVEDVPEGQRVFSALAEGGQVTMPFEKTFWTEGFGMVTDKFGVPWMVNVEHDAEH